MQRGKARASLCPGKDVEGRGSMNGPKDACIYVNDYRNVDRNVFIFPGNVHCFFRIIKSLQPLHWMNMENETLLVSVCEYLSAFCSLAVI